MMLVFARAFGPQFASGFSWKRTRLSSRDRGFASGCGSKLMFSWDGGVDMSLKPGALGLRFLVGGSFLLCRAWARNMSHRKEMGAVVFNACLFA